MGHRTLNSPSRAQPAVARHKLRVRVAAASSSGHSKHDPRRNFQYFDDVASIELDSQVDSKTRRAPVQRAPAQAHLQSQGDHEGSEALSRQLLLRHVRRRQRMPWLRVED